MNWKDPDTRISLAFGFAMMLYRLVCTNGMMSKNFFNTYRFKHEPNSENWEESLEQVTTNINAMANGSIRLEEFIHSLKKLNSLHVDVDQLGTIRHNHGDGWDDSTGRFTVPAGGAGLYWFHLHMGIIYTTSTSGNGYPRLWIKNSGGTQLFVPYTYFSHPDAGEYGSAHITATWDMAVGDYAYLTFHASNTKYYADQSELSFEGMRIG